MDHKLIVALNGTNYSTWRVQVKMLLINLNLWSIVTGSERSPTAESSRLGEFNLRKGKAVSTIVLTVNPSLYYLIGESTDPQLVWKKLEDHFQRST